MLEIFDEFLTMVQNKLMELLSQFYKYKVYSGLIIFLLYFQSEFKILYIKNPKSLKRCLINYIKFQTL